MICFFIGALSDVDESIDERQFNLLQTSSVVYITKTV